MTSIAGDIRTALEYPGQLQDMDAQVFAQHECTRSLVSPFAICRQTRKSDPAAYSLLLLFPLLLLQKPQWLACASLVFPILVDNFNIRPRLNIADRSWHEALSTSACPKDFCLSHIQLLFADRPKCRFSSSTEHVCSQTYKSRIYSRGGLYHPSNCHKNDIRHDSIPKYTWEIHQKSPSIQIPV